MDKTSSGRHQTANLMASSEPGERSDEGKTHQRRSMFLDGGQTKAEQAIHGPVTEERSR